MLVCHPSPFCEWGHLLRLLVAPHEALFLECCHTNSSHLDHVSEPFFLSYCFQFPLFISLVYLKKCSWELLFRLSILLSVISEMVFHCPVASHSVSGPQSQPVLIRRFSPPSSPSRLAFGVVSNMVVDGRSDGSSASRSVIGQPWSVYYRHLWVIYFSCVGLKMAAHDGDRPMWAGKHGPLQIPLFIHKLDPMGLLGWLRWLARFVWCLRR